MKRVPGLRRLRRLSMFWWLGLACAVIGAMGASINYSVTRIASGRTFDANARNAAVGRTQDVVQKVKAAPDAASVDRIIRNNNSDGYHLWLVDRSTTEPITNDPAFGLRFDTVPEAAQAAAGARDEDALIARKVTSLDDLNVAVAAPVTLPAPGEPLPDAGEELPEDDRQSARAPRVPAILVAAVARPSYSRVGKSILSGAALTAMIIAAATSTLFGFGLAAFITLRVRRLSDEAREIADGNLESGRRGRSRFGDELGNLDEDLGRMRAKLRENFARLEGERERLVTLLGSLDEGVLLARQDGVLAYTNAAAERILGRADRLPPVLWRALDLPVDAPRTLEATHLGRMLAISARPLTGALSGQLGLDGGQAGVALIVVRDRTEELLRQRAERDFVANAAHEMRNPVAAIRAAVDALEAGAKDDPDARTHFLDALAHESQRLGRLLRALLMLARAEAAAGTIATLTDAPIRPVLDRLAAGQPEVRVTCDPPRLVARCEPDLLEQALSALLSNALRHTATAVQLDARLDDAGVVTISVTDDGSGIPPTERAHVFERFYRGSNAAGEGAGLGLSIARRLVAAQGGTLSLAEAPAGAGGTRFLIRLPAGPTPLVDEVDAGAAATLGA